MLTLSYQSHTYILKRNVVIILLMRLNQNLETVLPSRYRYLWNRNKNYIANIIMCGACPIDTRLLLILCFTQWIHVTKGNNRRSASNIVNSEHLSHVFTLQNMSVWIRMDRTRTLLILPSLQLYLHRARWANISLYYIIVLNIGDWPVVVIDCTT